MLKLLLDEQISADVAVGLRRRSKGIQVFALTEWENGRLLGLSDDALLREAGALGLTLVTYDRRTIPPLLKHWAGTRDRHAGVIFVDNRTVPSSNFGGLIRALETIWKQAGQWDWGNGIYALRH